MLRAIVIAAAIGLAAPSYAQVIDIILDSPQLRAKNQRAMRSEHSGVDPVEQQRLSVQQSSPRRASDSWSRYQPPKSWWENYNNYEPPKSVWSSNYEPPKSAWSSNYEPPKSAWSSNYEPPKSAWSSQ